MGSLTGPLLCRHTWILNSLLFNRQTDAGHRLFMRPQGHLDGFQAPRLCELKDIFLTEATQISFHCLHSINLTSALALSSSLVERSHRTSVRSTLVVPLRFL